jgi:aerobic-type carbon monoxide dehydrogenase small subunit (CoxS/CutS family)
MEKTIRFTLNGKKTEVKMEPDQNLLWVLRNHFGLTGTKYGCGIGFCGACTILIDASAVRSCTMQIGEMEGKSIITIEGLSKGDQLHPVQEAFVEHDALQCGFCTPGMIINAVDLIKRNPDPTDQEIIEGMENNLCRCGAHIRIVEAVKTAAKEMKGRKK